MKFLRYISCAAAALSLLACQEVDKTCALAPDAVVAPVLDEHSDILVDADNLSSEVTFTWRAADYGYPAAVAYSLFCVYGDAEPYQVGESATTSYTLSKETLNNALVNSKGLNVPADETSTVFFYVVSSISTAQESAYTKKSNVIGLDITTVKSTSAPWIRRPLYVPGGHQGWTPATAPVLWETAENSDVYEGPVYLVPADATAAVCEFKFTDTPGWDGGNFGDSLDALGNNGGSGNLTVTPGTYWVKVTLTSDHSTGSAKLTPITAISVVGAYNSWAEDDVELTLAGLPEDYEAEGAADVHNAAVNAQIWECTIPAFTGGEFKFRLDHAWAQSWGGANLEHLDYNGGNCSTALTGTVRFAIDFHGDIAALAEDTTNPSPVSAVVAKVE
ncbi:SusE domain-containing protein [uncultured Alistipes sp.]|uniref:SusE domain-containing protein n=1 Tax=uncultured Alistipes sp. TaxID=538949 RepID=UPI00259151F0|nr:SusE domain-containing protein [uncultured Alistipes sp.]